jgi:hypothetical protein
MTWCVLYQTYRIIKHTAVENALRKDVLVMTTWSVLFPETHAIWYKFSEEYDEISALILKPIDYSAILTMEATLSSETSVNLYETASR